MSHLIPRPKAVLGVAPEKELATATQQGTLLTVRVNLPRYAKPKPGKRAKIMGFTRPARLRMLKRIACIDWQNAGKCLLVTLTYPDEIGVRTYDERTQDRTLFMRGVENHLSRQVATLWRVEHKVRQSGARKGRLAAHMHILLFNTPYLDKGEVRKIWRGVLGHVGPLATDVRATNDGRHASRYAAKYAAKAESLNALDYESYLDALGRAWGITRKELLPMAKERTASCLTPEQLGRAMQLAAQHLGREYVGSYFLFSDLALFHLATILGARIEELDTEDAPF